MPDPTSCPESAPLFRLKDGLELVLASASPRRRQFLEELGLPFGIFVPRCDEPRPQQGEDAQAYVLATARLKARAAQEQLGGQARQGVIVAADTVVVHDGEILGKPKDAAHALHMLSALAGSTHTVTTAVCLILPPSVTGAGEECFSDATQVRFHPWPQEVLHRYAHCGEPLDKAGAYAIQGRGAFLVAAVEGSWSTVVGLPVGLLLERLLARGIVLPA